MSCGYVRKIYELRVKCKFVWIYENQIPSYTVGSNEDRNDPNGGGSNVAPGRGEGSDRKTLQSQFFACIKMTFIKLFSVRSLLHLPEK